MVNPAVDKVILLTAPQKTEEKIKPYP